MLSSFHPFIFLSAASLSLRHICLRTIHCGDCGTVMRSYAANDNARNCAAIVKKYVTWAYMEIFFSTFSFSILSTKSSLCSCSFASYLLVTRSMNSDTPLNTTAEQFTSKPMCSTAIALWPVTAPHSLKNRQHGWYFSGQMEILFIKSYILLIVGCILTNGNQLTTFVFRVRRTRTIAIRKRNNCTLSVV